MNKYQYLLKKRKNVLFICIVQKKAVPLQQILIYHKI